MAGTVSEDQKKSALAHVAFATAEAARLPDIAPDAPTRTIATAAIIGAGTMGGGIAMALVAIGIPTVIIDAEQAALDRGIERIRGNYAFSVGRGKLEQAEMDRRMGLLSGSVALDDIASVDIVIEAVFEDMDLKQSLFRRIDAVAKPGAILATNTSALDIDVIAAVTARPQDVVGAHFFSPANVMRLLEVVRARETSADVVATLMALGRSMRKVSVQSLVSPGFIGNAMFAHYAREAIFLVEEGNPPARVDKAMTDFGFAMGFLAVGDMAGNDVGIQQRRKELPMRATDRRWPDLGMLMCDLGRLGQKTGSGFYRYDKGDRTPKDDPEFETIVARYAEERGIARRVVSDEETVERCLLGIINEGARLVEKGVALRPSDVDIVFVTGYGFPAWRGGPLYYADQVGLREIADKVKALHAEHGVWWEPSALLLRLADEGRTFAQYQEEQARTVQPA